MLASLVLTTAQAREVFSIVDWKFYPAYDVNRQPKMTDVKVPHSWNLEDVFQGMKYERGAYVYEHIRCLDGLHPRTEETRLPGSLF